MKTNQLGKTGLYVTELCFGALPYGPLQKNLNIEECAEITKKALEAGIHFVDTAQMYLTYEPIRLAMKKTGIRPIIASKSTAIDYEGMQKAIDEALQKLEIDYIDIFHLHAARADNTVFQAREGALRCLQDNKKAGKIRAIGISTHSVLATKEAALEPSIDVVFPIINITGVGILHGTRDDMYQAIEACVKNEKGVYLMKALGGGSLLGQYQKAMDYALSIPGIASVAVGVVSIAELDFNLNYFNGQNKEGLALPTPKETKKQFLVVKYICNNCGKCREICPNEAIFENEGYSCIDDSKCLTCGYCVGACDLFGIRMI